jgi:hypothetical protein
MTQDKNELKNNNDKKTINVYLEMDYNTYKNKIKNFIFEHFKLILEIFDENFNDNLVKLYILHKKNLLENYHIEFATLIIDFCNYLNSLNYIDQQEYFIVTLKLFNIFLFSFKIKKNSINSSTSDNNSINFNKVQLIGNKYIKLINIELLTKNIFKCIELISKNNIIIEIFLLFINNKNKYYKKNILLLSEKLSFDLFMYWSSNDLYKIITNNTNITKNKLILSLKKYKNDFINSYERNTNTLKKLYLDQTNSKLILKYRLCKDNLLFAELMKDIKSIDVNL